MTFDGTFATAIMALAICSTVYPCIAFDGNIVTANNATTLVCVSACSNLLEVSPSIARAVENCGELRPVCKVKLCHYLAWN